MSKKLGDTVLEGLAYNSLGVDAMMIACPPAEGSRFEGRRALPEEARAMLVRAVEYHQKCVRALCMCRQAPAWLTGGGGSHLDISDEGGQFVARTNLGLCFGLMADLASATSHHQDALRLAIQLQSHSGQGISVGNLGLVAMRQGDLPTAKACLEQHLQLVQNLKDVAAETNAWIQVGTCRRRCTPRGNLPVTCWGLCRAAGQPGEPAKGLRKRVRRLRARGCARGGARGTRPAQGPQASHSC